MNRGDQQAESNEVEQQPQRHQDDKEPRETGTVSAPIPVIPLQAQVLAPKTTPITDSMGPPTTMQIPATKIPAERLNCINSPNTKQIPTQ